MGCSMRKMMITLLCVTIFDASGMDESRALEEAEAFFKTCPHDIFRKWKDGVQQQVIQLDFKGRTAFINSVRSDNVDRINNFKIVVPIANSLKAKTEFALKNNKPTKYSSTYLFFSEGEEAKPYLYNLSKRTIGILDDFIFANPSHPPLYSRYIGNFATNVLRILKSEQPILEVEELNTYNRTANRYVINTSIEIATMILTTERARDEYSVLVSYIEFYKLKRTAKTNQQEMLLNMFFHNAKDVDGRDPTLKFPKVKNQQDKQSSAGGAALIRRTSWEYLYDEFTDMLNYSPYYEKVQQLPEFMHTVLGNEFYGGKLEKLKAISENRLQPRSKFKKLVDASETFFNSKMKKIVNKWKALKLQSASVSEQELENAIDCTLTDPYANVFDEYDKNPLNPTMPGHHDHFFRSDKNY